MPLNFLSGALSSGLSAGVSSGITSLIGGLFGKKKKKKTSNTIDYVALRRNAEAGGFNPLTALRNGGSAGFMQTHHPVLSSSSYVENALTSGVNAFLSHDPREEERAELEQQIMEGQLERIQQTNEYYRNLDVPTATAPTVRSTNSSVNPVTTLSGAPQPPEIKTPEAVNPWPADVGAHIDERAPNAETWEDRYGDIFGGLIGGGYNLYRDIKKNIRSSNYQYLIDRSHEWPKRSQWSSY